MLGKGKLISLLVVMLSLLTACVHEFPVDRHERVPFLLHLDFSTEMPLHQEVIYTRSAETGMNDPAGNHDIRYIVNAYRTDNRRGENRVADTTFVFTKSDVTDLNYTADLKLQEGTYDFRVWADYVDKDSADDKYYDTHDFSEIILADRKNHPGSNDFRDAFRGYASGTVTNPSYYTGSAAAVIDNQATAEMKRPMGKFMFVSTDREVFLRRVVQMMKERGTLMSADGRTVDLDDFKVVFRYNPFMPCSFNMFTDKPADSWPGMSFVSRMRTGDNNEIHLGHDYIFVNGTETILAISVEVYNRKGELMSSSNPINVPVVRSKLTVVRGEFLTSKATGGITINPGFDGDDYNVEIY